MGDYSYELSRLTGHVIAFEPNPKLAKLVQSLRLRGLEVKQMALSSQDGTAELWVPTTSGYHGLASLRQDVVAGRATERVSVPTRRLDGLGLKNVAFIKIDVEGFEEAVLDGAIETIARDRPILLIEIEERHNVGGLARIRDRLASLGYSGYFFLDGKRLPLKTFDPELHQKVSDDIENVGQSVSRREFRYVNNFLFEPASPAVPPASR
jgi:FkbM family methyltransferase